MRKRIPLGPIELLRHLMRQRNMSIQDLARILKSGEIEAQNILDKQQTLSPENIQRLSKSFQVEPQSFSPEKMQHGQ
jgi:antitoxin component HigA of HigAB toxin-antitoxin module